MICGICGKEGARVRRVTRSYGKGEICSSLRTFPLSVAHTAVKAI
jgi:hypothetical protein